MELMTIGEVANYFNVKPHTIRNWIRREQIPPKAIFKIGATVRIKKHQLVDFIFKTA
ncbi:MAG: helix-turn-helix domain-containing protein [bacterium]